MRSNSLNRGLGALLALCLTVTGCAGFHPTHLPVMQLDDFSYRSEQGGVTVAFDDFSRPEIKTYFASDLASKNIWPVRIMIVNGAGQSYLFSKGMIDPTVANSHETARRGRRAAGHRLFWGWLFTATFFGIPIGVPLLVTGFQALSANSSMETEFKRLEIQDGTVEPGETRAGVIYFHQPNLPDTIRVDLLNAQTNDPLKISVGLKEQPVSAVTPKIVPDVTPTGF